MSEEKQFALVNGEYKQVDAPAVSVTNRGLMYGDGCFETFCAYQGRFFKLAEHLDRLKAGLDYLDIDYPKELRLEPILPLLKELLLRNNHNHKEAILRAQVWRDGSRGYATSSRNSGYAITTSPRPDVNKNYNLSTVSTRRIPSAALPSNFKFTNGLNYINAAREAKKKGGDDALMQTMDGMISETTVANIFWMTEGEIFTPSEACDVLAGITRNEIISCLSVQMNRSVHTGQYTLDDINKADAIWICNSVKEVAPVKQIDNAFFNILSPFLKELQSAFQSHIRKNLDEGI